MKEGSWLLAMVAAALYWAATGSRWAALLAAACYLVLSEGRPR